MLRKIDVYIVKARVKKINVFDPLKVLQLCLLTRNVSMRGLPLISDYSSSERPCVRVCVCDGNTSGVIVIMRLNTTSKHGIERSQRPRLRYGSVINKWTRVKCLFNIYHFGDCLLHK